MMVIADSCKHPIEMFGLDEWTTRRTVTACDRKSVIQMRGADSDMSIGFYEKEAGNMTLLATRVQQPGKDYISDILVVPPSVPAQETPLDTLRELCDRYGLSMRVGDTEETFVVQSEVPVPGPIVSGSAPKGHDLIQSMLVRNTGSGTMMVALAFCLDLTEILADIG